MATKSALTKDRPTANGRFVAVAAGAHSATTVREPMPNPGRGDIGRDTRSGQFLKPVSKPGTITQSQADKAVREYRSKK
jgi:hypothetical protein